MPRSYIVYNPGSHPAPKWIAARMAEDGVLDQYWTSAQLSSHSKNSRWFSALPKAVQKEFNSRQLPLPLLGSVLKRAALLQDIAASISRRFGDSRLERRLLHARNRAIASRIVRQLRRGVGEDVWVVLPSNTHGGLALKCQSLGIPYALYTPLPFSDFSSALMAEEEAANPDWAGHLHFVADDPLAGDPDATVEAAGASLVLANSNFTARSFMNLNSPERVVAIPLAVDLERFRRLGLLGSAVSSRAPNEPLRVAYSGHISQRKGLSYLFEALNTIPNYENYLLTVVGSDSTQMEAQLRQSNPNVRARFLQSLPQEELWSLLSQQHVFVFPTLLDGFGNVLIEASALGLPTIATDRCGSLDIGLIPTGGILIEAQSSSAIRNALQKLFDDEPARTQMGINATMIIEHGRSWTDYGNDVIEALSMATPFPTATQPSND